MMDAREDLRGCGCEQLSTMYGHNLCDAMYVKYDRMRCSARCKRGAGRVGVHRRLLPCRNIFIVVVRIDFGVGD